jgi:biopolymer transport protein ExbD
MLIKAKEQGLGATVELTPLIDMVFLLLIFFLVATTFKQQEREMQIALPVAQAAGPISATLRELIVNVEQSGTIIVGGRRIEVEELRALISEAVEVNPEQKVTVRGDRRTAYNNVVRVLDICKASGIQEPYLDTVLTE